MKRGFLGSAKKEPARLCTIRKSTREESIDTLQATAIDSVNQKSIDSNTMPSIDITYKKAEKEVSLPSKPTNRRQLDVLATILANKTKLCGQPPKHPIEMRKELLGGGPVKEKHMSSCLKEVSKQLHLPETSKHA
ncbi:hypothetical protein F2Q68_00025191 [Brassica cretica]|uniref:Uncharacterized protein n=1 Tax=Brassica cretica TaxID=69181 RepID=A0A8S9I7B0_BRACR|nr:hypothetical protein F2Q68_00025191 [Brassica cretica]